MNNLSIEQFENGIKIYQDNNMYKFTSDAINLAKFAKIKPKDNVLDLCAGCGVVGLYAYSIKPFNKLYFNEIQTSMCQLIEKNIQINQLQEKCKIINDDLNNLTLSQFAKPLDVILCNPPYFKVNSKINPKQELAMCRHEIATNLSQIVAISSKLIKSGGKLYLVLPAERLCECVVELDKVDFEVKQVELITHKNLAEICLIEAVKFGKSGVNISVKND